MLVSMKALIKYLLTETSFCTYSVGGGGGWKHSSKNVKNSEESEILSYLHTNNLACYGFVEDIDPQSTDELFTAVAVARISTLLPHFPQGDAKRQKSPADGVCCITGLEPWA